ncbi:hypothetical protein IZU89_06215 [Cellulophaga lytica]
MVTKPSALYALVIVVVSAFLESSSWLQLTIVATAISRANFFIDLI